ncbi:hypothetical protein J4E85_011116 [Alternaria conjuncta]|uniref:uncharacterized protein n=1 Tax=Alternaria conjuncta TaxID=181017 RepID=UPI0022208EA1|nr:uncharacterized protein J4E85_011116 [Alternaria conjuncta]KAI4605380.1 hypothetical protein J4E80_010643 [Alternaria sp. BMP 0032]KAI4912182.1 hypothetical protein J4E85_011116 [Alternaria conjuncta]
MDYLRLIDSLWWLMHPNTLFGLFSLLATTVGLYLGIQNTLLFGLVLVLGYFFGRNGASFNCPYWYLRGVPIPADMKPSDRETWITRLRGELARFGVIFVRERSEGMSGMSEVARAAYIEELFGRLHDAADAMTDEEKRAYGKKLARQFMWFQEGSVGWLGMGGSLPPMPPGVGEYGSGYGGRHGLTWIGRD